MIVATFWGGPMDGRVEAIAEPLPLLRYLRPPPLVSPLSTDWLKGELLVNELAYERSGRIGMLASGETVYRYDIKR